MNKLTETDKAKEYLELCQRRMVYDESTHIIASLLSLLEEKDKALERIIEYHKDRSISDIEACRRMKNEATKALNTSSNNEGEV